MKDEGVRHLIDAQPLEILGGAERDRTVGLQSAILALSQLSYCPVPSKTAKRIEHSARRNHKPITSNVLDNVLIWDRFLDAFAQGQCSLRGIPIYRPHHIDRR